MIPLHTHHVEIRTSRRRFRRPQFYSVILANNGNVIFTSELYHNKTDCYNAAHNVITGRINPEIKWPQQ